jgi:hypothetical protein
MEAAIATALNNVGSANGRDGRCDIDVSAAPRRRASCCQRFTYTVRQPDDRTLASALARTSVQVRSLAQRLDRLLVTSRSLQHHA